MANEFKHKDPCTTLTQCEYIGADGTGHVFASQATGDLLYADSATVLSRLARACSGSQMLQIASCKPAWTATPSLGTTSWCNMNHAHAAANSGGTVCANVLAGTTLKSCVVTSSLTTVGALNSGSISCGFGAIDNGSSAITTTGLISGGSLDIDDVLINGTTIGHTCDTDLLTLGNATLLAKGTVTVGVCGTGHDVKLFGCAAGAYMEWDESANLLEVRGATAAGPGHLKLTTGEATVVACDVLGKIEFQAPAETGADALRISASIAAVAQATFDATNNATDLVFYTGHSEDAAEKFRFTSQGEIGIGGANYGTDGQVLTSGGAGAAPAWEDAGGLSAATACEVAAASSNTVVITPGRAQNHPSAVKAHVHINSDGTIKAGSYGISGIDDDGTGDRGINFSTAFATADEYTGVESLYNSAGYIQASNWGTGSHDIVTKNASGSATDIISTGSFMGAT